MFTTLSESWHDRASPLARQALAFYVFVIVYASLYPFGGWHDTGISPWAYLFAPWPRWLTRFDIVTNVLAYLPLGALAVLALHPRCRGMVAALIATVLCAALSAGMEAIQTYLPNRVSSNTDLLFNSLGALIGAAGVAPFAPAMLERGRLRNLRLRLFDAGASQGLLLVATWFVAQLFPQPMLFGTGEFVSVLHSVFEHVREEPIRWQMLDTITPEGFAIAEAVCAASALAGSALLLLQLARPAAPRVALLIVFALASVAMRSFATAVAFGLDDLFLWATPGARLGVAVGCVLALACSYAPPAVRRAFALGLLAASVIVVNSVPENPYFAAIMADWRQGMWVNFNGLLRVVAIAWPYLAIAYLFVQRPRGRRL